MKSESETNTNDKRPSRWIYIRAVNHYRCPRPGSVFGPERVAYSLTVRDAGVVISFLIFDVSFIAETDAMAW